MTHRSGFMSRFLTAILAAALLGPAFPACAAVLTVTDPDDDPNNVKAGTFRRIFWDYNDGDEIRFADNARNVNLRAELVFKIGKTVKITGPATIVPTQYFPGTRFFIVPKGATGVMKDLTLYGGLPAIGSGGALLNAGTLTMEGCTLQNNQCHGDGGALFADVESVTTLTNCTISGNKLLNIGDSGGGICLYKGTLTMTGCTVKNNTGAFYGGGVDVYGKATLTNCIFESNVTYACGMGGGIYSGGTLLTLLGCTVRNNTAGSSQSGGGICSAGGAGSLVLKNKCVITGNTPDNVSAYGGYVSDGTNTIGNAPNQTATVLDGYSGPTEPTPRSIGGDADVAAVSRDLADPKSALAAVVTEALSNDLGHAPGGASAVLSGMTASLYYANTFENVAIASLDLAIEYTASWPESVRYYALFARADGSGYEIPERGVKFEIKAGQSLPDGVTPPSFYVPGEGLMTWRNLVTDGGSFDLNPTPGVVTFRVCSVRAVETTPDRKEGGGCDVGMSGFAPLALLLGAPLLALVRSGKCGR